LFLRGKLTNQIFCNFFRKAHRRSWL
jgi:hypothetical protein